MRQLHQELLRLAADVHPQARVVDAVAAGLASKNNRQATLASSYALHLPEG